MKEIILALGTNLGDRLQNLQEALVHLAPEVQVTRLSSIYETEPWGYADQPRFLNQVVFAKTELEPLALLQHLKHIEDALMRIKTIRNGPRTIDLDILFYDDVILESEILTIPHPRLAERAFVMVPLAEIAPDFIHPVLKKSMRGIIQNMQTAGVELYQPETGRTRNSTSMISIPEDVRAALESSPSASERFENLPASHRKEYLDWISEAKKEETRARRIEQFIKKLLEQA